MGDPEGNCAVSTTDVKAGGHVIRLNRAGQGNGPAVLFLHGSGPGATGMSNFSGNVEAFAEHHDCLIIDQSGAATPAIRSWGADVVDDEDQWVVTHMQSTSIWGHRPGDAPPPGCMEPVS
jgi:pimeloyl-ACP methyl ester carboxylesterase